MGSYHLLSGHFWLVAALRSTKQPHFLHCISDVLSSGHSLQILILRFHSEFILSQEIQHRPHTQNEFLLPMSLEN